MAYRARIAGRTLRLDVARSPGGRLIVQVADLAGGAAASGTAAGAPAAQEPRPARTYALDASRAGGWLLARLDDGRSIEAFVERRGEATAVWVDGVGYDLELTDERALRRRPGGPAAGGPRRLVAPMPGKIVKHLVAVGDRVEAGQGVIVVEAMKMENELRAPAAGVVSALPAAEGTAVEAGATLVVLE